MIFALNLSLLEAILHHNYEKIVVLVMPRKLDLAFRGQFSLWDFFLCIRSTRMNHFPFGLSMSVQFKKRK